MMPFRLPFKRLCQVRSEPRPTQAFVDQVLDVADYPRDHTWFLFTTSNGAPPAVNAALSDAIFGPLHIPALVERVAFLLDRATSGTSHDHPIDLDDHEAGASPSTLTIPDEDSDPDVYHDDDDDFDNFDGVPRAPAHDVVKRKSITSLEQETLAFRLRADLRKAKDAGFRVAFIGDLNDLPQACYVMVSCRVAKLGIADDALKAWGLERRDYIMLITHYAEGYKTLEDVGGPSSSRPKHGMSFHVGVTQKHKISSGEAVTAFSSLDPKSKADDKSMLNAQAGGQPAKGSVGRSLFIGRPINEMLNTRLLQLIMYRKAMGIPWKGAEWFYNDYQGRPIGEEDIIVDAYFQDDGPNFSKNLPNLVKQDEILSADPDKSFPLVAMQFTLRHVVRCTDFCLVCHSRVKTDFEALKPFVCSNPLCLFQYMTLGIGPSIEYDIATQPYVVDLLISLAWASANSLAMKELPNGMNLKVPPVRAIPGFRKGVIYRYASYMSSGHLDPSGIGKQTSSAPTPRKAFWQPDISELNFSEVGHSVKVGEWVVLCLPDHTEEHRRVNETTYWPRIRLGPAVKTSATPLDDDGFPTPYHRFTSRHRGVSSPTPPEAKKPPTPKPEGVGPCFVDVVVYDTVFDNLDRDCQQDTIRYLLDTLPSVLEMQSYLKKQGEKHMNLRAWADRINPPVMGILRWILASNRSCIVQIDDVEDSVGSAEERVYGMPGWLQFRFAQGAPDKEQRFIQSVRDTTQGQQFPTLFLWHGSPLRNWHCIVREGLKFDTTEHGRAYGHGVYLAPQAQTSLGYSGGAGSHYDYHGSYLGWSSSQLRVSTALCLNEVVNAPQQFISSTPHCVVNKVDWIQTRYLFVSCASSSAVRQESGMTKVEVKPTTVLAQDPSYTPRGTTNEPIVVPVTAISKTRRPQVTSVQSGNKKLKLVAEGADAADDFVSDESDAEDVALFHPTSKVASLPGAKDRQLPEIPKTDFVPGTLDFSTLPLFAQPSYATPLATKSLQRELTNMLKTQKSTPAYELGWHLDPEHVDNVYQWILELHSFDASLPLAADLKARGLTSVVLELRFGPGFPFSPPFARVVRPRFVPFLAGGGGHVTAGGALCMELLTNSGWNSTSTIEAVLLQVRLALSSTEPKPARLVLSSRGDYGVGEAMEAYRRACMTHGWQVPPEFANPAFAAAGTTDRRAGPSM